MTTEKSAPEPAKPSRAPGEVRLRQHAIGLGLRALFDEVVNEEVPHDFLDILRDADSRSPEKG